jgi:predicted permease
VIASQLARDLRHAIRTIAHMPVLASVIVLSLGAGIGINTVVFTWIQARIINPIPGVSGAGRIRLVEPKNEADMYPGASWLEYQDLRHTLRSFPELFASRMVPLYVGDEGNVERLFGLLVSDNYFSALGVQPALGRFLRPEEAAQPGREPVAVISYGLWQLRFAGSPDALGSTLRVNGRHLTVIGVAPAEFQGTVMGLNFDLWLPATLAPVVANGSRELDQRSFRGYALMGRLAADRSPEQAQSELTTTMQQLAKEYPETNAKIQGEVLPLWQSPRGPNRMLNTALLVLQGLMLLLLAAVCGNVANLVLARASARQKEMGARLALGARPRHIVSLVITENVLLAVLGALAGAAIATWGTSGLMVLPLSGLPFRFQTSVDALTLTFAIGLGIISGLAFGAIPAVQLSRIEPVAALRTAGGTVRRSLVRNAVMAVQVGLAIVVLVVAALFVRSYLETKTLDTGFRRDDVLLVTYDLSGRSANGAFSRDLARRMLERLRALPGVRQASIASSVPLDIHGLPSRIVTVDGRARADGNYDEALSNTVTPGYFDTLGIAFVAGADFADLTTADGPQQAIVNEEFVKRYLGSGEPLGRGLQARGGRYVIVGVVKNSIYNAFGEPPTPAIHFSYRDQPQPRGEVHLRTAGPPGAIATEVRRAMQEVDGDLPVFNVRSMADHVDTNLIFRRIPAQMFAVLGPLLLMLAAIGIYAVVNYSVSVRTMEIGVRLALGATVPKVVRHFVTEHFTIVLAGAIVGWTLAFVVSKGFLNGAGMDVTVFAGVPAVLLGVASIACWFPAWKAARTQPMGALRE